MTASTCLFKFYSNGEALGLIKLHVACNIYCVYSALSCISQEYMYLETELFYGTISDNSLQISFMKYMLIANSFNEL